MKSLLLGCGNSRKKQIIPPGAPKEFDELVTVDITDCGADIVCDLDYLPYPFKDEEYDEIHAYEVLEHTGDQGDERFFFRQFNELWRTLKPDGYLCLSVPLWNGKWAWGDPGHRRVFTPDTFSFLEERHYDQLGVTSCADYRHLIEGYWKIVDMIAEGSSLFVLLQKS